MTLEEITVLSGRDTVALLLTCCGSKRWAREMSNRKPYRSTEELYNIADEVWFSLNEKDWKEAFARHPKIGDIKSLRRKFQSTAEMASKEQSGVTGAFEKTLDLLAKGNSLYESKFGYIFIVCATGKSADEMLTLLNDRLNNYPDIEIKIAAREQAKITRIRLEKIIQN